MLINVTPKNYISDRGTVERYSREHTLTLGGIPQEKYYHKFQEGINFFNGGAKELHTELFENLERESRIFQSKISDNNKTLPLPMKLEGQLYEPLLVKVVGRELFPSVVQLVLRKGVWRRAGLQSSSLEPWGEERREYENMIERYNCNEFS